MRWKDQIDIWVIKARYVLKSRKKWIRSKSLRVLEPEKVLAFFEFQTPSFEVKLDRDKMILPSFLSYISTYVSFENAKFGDDLSTLAEENICRGRQSSRKWGFSTNNNHFLGQ